MSPLNSSYIPENLLSLGNEVLKVPYLILSKIIKSLLGAFPRWWSDDLDNL